MIRFACSFVALAGTAFALASPALAADWGDGGDYRDGFDSLEPKDWAMYGDQDDSLRFEFGIRYYYSMGTQSFSSAGGAFTTQDQSHSAELHLRIDDDSTNFYANAFGGTTFLMQGTFSGGGATGNVIDGHLYYAGADLGWNAFGDNHNGAGLIGGYTWWNDSPRTTRANFTNATSGAQLQYDPNTGQIFYTGNSKDTDINIHALKIGVGGRAEIGDMIDITGEASFVPIASVSGILGNHDVPLVLTPLGNPAFVKTSQTDISGLGYGAMGQVMLGFKPFENAVFRIGGRAWYVQGTYDATYTAAQVSDPTDANLDGVYDTPPVFVNQGYIETRNPFSLFRFGVLAEATYQF